MGKTVIYCTPAMSTIIIALYSSMVTTSLVLRPLFPFYPPPQIKMEKQSGNETRLPCARVYAQECPRTQDPSQYMSTQNLISYGWTLFWCRAFIAYHIWPGPLSMVGYATQLSICARLSSRPYSQLLLSPGAQEQLYIQLLVIATCLYTLEFGCQNHL